MIVSLPNELHFKLDQENHTASLTTSPDVYGDIFIPRSINYQSTDYLITSISKDAFTNPFNEIKSIDFPKNSAFRTFEKGSLSASFVHCLTIPASVDELQDGWCKGASNLTKIKLSPKNNNFKLINDKILLGKSNPKTELFDTLHFVCRKASKITLPSYVKYIKPYSFSYCEYLEEITINEDSQLLKIGKKAFEECPIERLFIPQHFEMFEDGWCKNISELHTITISPGNKNFIFLDEKFLIGKSNPKTKIYDDLLFAVRDIKSAIIPSFVRFISSYSFNLHSTLTNLVFSKDSKLISIGHDAFYGCSFEKVYIPKNVRNIDKYAFGGCSNLKEVEFDEDCEIESFTQDLFCDSAIEKINIPKNLVELENGWNWSLSKLNNVLVSSKNKNFMNINEKMIATKSDLNSDVFDTLCFGCRDIQKVIVPSNIISISSKAFEYCLHIEKVEFTKKSNLRIFQTCAFAVSSIKSIVIPSSVQFIGESVFLRCRNLKTVEFEENSELEIIYPQAFCETSIKSIKLPSSLLEIENSCFNSCRFLSKIEFPENSELRRIHSYAFLKTNINGIIIPSKVSIIDDEVFSFCINLKSIEFLSQVFLIGSHCFKECKSLFLLSFPNLVHLKIMIRSLVNITDKIVFYIPSDAEVLIIYN